MMITERQEKILNTMVAEYINSAQPVSSKLLEKKYDFDVSPATIRNEMQKLTDAGFVHQPHTSAGRVPTDKGYRFFVDNLFKEEKLEPEDIFGFEDIFRKERDDVFKFASHLTKYLADRSSNFVIFHLLKNDFFWKEGWEEIIEQPEFEEKDLIFNFAKLLENFEETIDGLKINSGIKIYIGRENPFRGAKEFSTIISKCHLPDKEEGLISILGPKRMAYDRNIGLMNSLINLLERV